MPEEEKISAEGMPWIDRTKGRLDYLLGIFPVLSFFFVVFAYFHTVHPMFSREEELEKASRRVAELQLELARNAEESLALAQRLDLAKSEVVAARQELSYLKQVLTDVLPTDEASRLVTHSARRFYSARDMIAAYLERERDDGGLQLDESKLLKRDIFFENGVVQLVLLTHSDFCGSGGCGGALFQMEYGSYCFVGWVHSKKIDDLSDVRPALRDLNCRDIAATRLWLE